MLLSQNIAGAIIRNSAKSKKKPRQSFNPWGDESYTVRANQLDFEYWDESLEMEGGAYDD